MLFFLQGVLCRAYDGTSFLGFDWGAPGWVRNIKDTLLERFFQLERGDSRPGTCHHKKGDRSPAFCHPIFIKITDATTITIPAISQPESGWWNRKNPRSAAVTGSMVVSWAALEVSMPFMPDV